MSLPDLYVFALPLFTILLIASLLTLKLSLQSIPKVSASPPQPIPPKHVCPVFTYLIYNFTVLEIFLVRTGRRKMPLLLSYGFISLQLYFCPFWFPSLAIPTSLNLSVFIFEILSFGRDPAPTCDEAAARQTRSTSLNKIIYSISGIITVSIYLLLCSLAYKNYHNNQLQNLLQRLGLVFAADNFVIKPLSFLLFAIITSPSQLPASYALSQINWNQYSGRVVNSHVEPVVILKNCQKSGVEFQQKAQKKSSQLFQHYFEGSCENILSKDENVNQGIKDHKELIAQIEVKNFYEIVTDEIGRKRCINVYQAKQDLQICELKEQIYPYFYQQSISDKKDEEILTENQKKNDMFQQRQRENFGYRNTISHNLQPVLLQSEDEDPCLFEFSNQERIEPSETVCSHSIYKPTNKNIRFFKQYQLKSEYELSREAADVEESKRDDLQSRQRCTTFSRGGGILRIQEKQGQAELEEIKLENPQFQKCLKTFFENNIMNEQDKECINTKRHRRRATRPEVSQLYTFAQKIYEIYMPGKNKSVLDCYMAKKRSLQTYEFSRLEKKSQKKVREKPVFHENDENQPQFFIPNF